MRTLIIDNYDSYTFNLYQYCIAIDSHTPVVIRNDQYSWETLREEFIPHFDVIIISPGPGSPHNTEDFGVCEQVLKFARIPILGVCLGHQGLACVYGGKIIKANTAMHGRIEPVFHKGEGLFKNIPSPFNVVRYHTLPNCTRANAWSYEHSEQGKSRIIMGLEHKEKPIFGVQFHPEQHRLFNIPNQLLKTSVIPSPISHRPKEANLGHHLKISKLLDVKVDASTIYEKIFHTESPCVWLDSARVLKNLSRFSFMGNLLSKNSFLASYWLKNKTVSIEKNFGLKYSTEKTEVKVREHETFFSWLQDTLDFYGLSTMDVNENFKVDELSAAGVNIIHEKVPFDFLTGFCGYIGYEMKNETIPFTKCSRNNMSRNYPDKPHPIPDASFLFLDKVLVVDHETNHIWTVELLINGEDGSFGEEMFREISLINDSIIPKGKKQNITKKVEKRNCLSNSLLEFSLQHCKSEYMKNVEASIDKIIEGETYEVCLTTQIKINNIKNESFNTSFNIYKHLRERNPAPYSAFLNFGSKKFSLVSSSPEKFLNVDKAGFMMMKPIKGTVARVLTGEKILAEDQKRRYWLENSVKDKAENLMIVDLIRNDLNLISEPNTVDVPRLMKVETYATVHQLVSTVTGKLRKDLSSVDALKATFPPGSMTGAPKQRTVEILEQLEGHRRGPYSGVLGFFSVAGVASDFSVVIRTAVCTEEEITVGAGGAIIMLSTPEEEFDEMLLKADSVLPSIEHILL
ncbi:hypothetical protein HK099_004642 [Clydaea vesicula]|uniref:aminodeoxychorismate synthase n=1 Tax=Clydaea vesicula TaxID=447962 RepID=A0AAD5XY38_9FUNG|nr:hypothetical protein HK099_004642 [Clydaea vesicula]